MPEDVVLTSSVDTDALVVDLAVAELTVEVLDQQAVLVNGVELHALVYSKAT